MGNVRQALIWGTIGAAFAVGAVAGATSGHDAAVPGGDTGALWHLLLLWPALAFLVMSAAYLSPRWVVAAHTTPRLPSAELMVGAGTGARLVLSARVSVIGARAFRRGSRARGSRAPRRRCA